jgi:hypothetical protein
MRSATAPGTLRPVHLVFRVREIVANQQLPGAVAHPERDVLSLPVPFPGGVDRALGRQRVREPDQMHGSQAGRRRFVEHLHRAHGVFQAGRQIAEVVVDEREVEVTTGQQRAAAVLDGPPVDLREGQRRYRRLTLSLVHVRLGQPGPQAQDRLAKRRGGAFDLHRIGEHRVDVVPVVVLQSREPRREVGDRARRQERGARRT